jgi:hypothetical protein
VLAALGEKQEPGSAVGQIETEEDWGNEPRASSPVIIPAHERAINCSALLENAAWTPQTTTSELIEIEMHKLHLLFR